MGSFKNDSANEEPAPESGKLDRAHELTWALLDERITDAEMTELENLLRTDKKALESYSRCMQLHSDLAYHFAPPSKSSKKSTLGLPISGILNSSLPNLGADSPTAGDAR